VTLVVQPGDVTGSGTENTVAHSDALSLSRPARSQHNAVSCAPFTPTYWIYRMAAGSGPSFLRWILVLLTVSGKDI
jgi:hypothetical protein